MIKSGALVERKGNVNLIRNLVIVKKNFTMLNVLKKKVREVNGMVKEIIQRESDEENLTLLRKLQGRLSEVESKRDKRSLLPFVGNILNGLFGVATEKDVERERERMDKIEKWAAKYGHVIHEMVNTMIKNVQIMNDVRETLNRWKELLSSALCSH